MSPTILMALGAELSQSDFLVAAAAVVAAIVVLLTARAVAVRVHGRAQDQEHTR